MKITKRQLRQIIKEEIKKVISENELSRHASGHSSPEQTSLYATRRDWKSSEDDKSAQELAQSLYSIVSTLAKAKLKTGPPGNRQWRPELTKMIKLLNYIGVHVGEIPSARDLVDHFNDEWNSSQRVKQDMSNAQLDKLEVSAEKSAIEELKELEQFLNSHKHLIHPKLHDSFKKELAVIKSQPAPAPSGEFRGAKE